MRNCTGLNRTIIELKLFFVKERGLNITRLNRTIIELKHRQQPLYQTLPYVLIVL